MDPRYPWKTFRMDARWKATESLEYTCPFFRATRAAKTTIAARWAIEHGDARACSSGIEFLDNTLESDSLSNHVGGAMYLFTCDLDVSDCLFEGNDSQHGAAGHSLVTTPCSDPRGQPRGESGDRKAIC